MVRLEPTVVLVVQAVSVASMAGGFGGFEDIFSSFFGGGGSSRNPTLLVKVMTSSIASI